jgi:hypothetical protein
MGWFHRLLGGDRRRLLASAATAVLVLIGLGAIGVGCAAQQHAPQPQAAAALPTRAGPQPTSSSHPSDPNPQPSTPAVTVLPAAVPTFLDIPAIGVHHRLLRLGQNQDGTVQVPPLSDVAAPGWDRYSPTPGQLGPAVILGHIDSAVQGKGVFYDLGALHPGDTVSVTRADHIVAVFRIDGVNSYSKDAFPTLTVYGNTPDAQLRLITCGGQFDAATHNYLDNIVAFATLVGSHPGATLGDRDVHRTASGRQFPVSLHLPRHHARHTDRPVTDPAESQTTPPSSGGMTLGAGHAHPLGRHGMVVASNSRSATTV